MIEFTIICQQLLFYFECVLKNFLYYMCLIAYIVIQYYYFTVLLDFSLLFSDLILPRKKYNVYVTMSNVSSYSGCYIVTFVLCR